MQVQDRNFELPKIGFGTYSIPSDKLISIIRNNIDSKSFLIDTALKYQNETTIREAIADRPNNLIIQSKVHFAHLVGRRKYRYFTFGSHSVKQSLKLSGKNIGRYPDIYLIHSPFNGYETYLHQLELLSHNNAIKAFGVCNVTKEQLITYHNLYHSYPDIVQVEIHPYHSNQGLIDFCKSNQIIVEARSPFAHGDAMFNWTNEDIFKTLSQKYNKSTPQIILRWIVQQGVIPLPRTSNQEHFKENFEIFDFTLTESEMNGIFHLNIDKSFGFRTNVVY